MITTHIAPSEPMFAFGTQAGMGVAPQKSEEITDLQLMQVQMDTQKLEAQAFEIEEMARRMAGDPALNDEREHAITQANLMRGTVKQVNEELSSAPTNPQTGKKKLPAGRVANIIGTLEAGIHVGEQEKKALTESINDPAAHGSSHKTEVKTASAEPGAIGKMVRKICHLPSARTEAAASRAQASGLSGWLQRTQATAAGMAAATSDWFNRSVNSVSDTMHGAWESITQFSPLETLSHVGDTVTQTAKSVARKVVDRATAAQEYVVVTFEVHVTKPAVALGKAAMKTLHETRTALDQAVDSGVSKTKTAIADARQWAGDTLAEKKRWVMSLFEDEKPETKTVTKLVKVQAKAPVPANDHMATALKQAAAAIGIPLALNGQSVSDMFSFSTPNLPNLNAALAHLPSLY